MIEISACAADFAQLVAAENASSQSLATFARFKPLRDGTRRRRRTFISAFFDLLQSAARMCARDFLANSADLRECAAGRVAAKRS
jgi:hypothetical protein